MILAGPKLTSEPIHMVEKSGVLQSDPWANFFQNKKGPVEGGGVSKAPSSGSTVVRAPEGPIEDRFKKQDAQIETLKTSVQLMSQQLDRQNNEHKDFQKQVALEFKDIKTDFSKQLEKIN